MRRRHRLALVLVLACAACAPRVQVEADPAEDFSAWTHWAWLPRRASAPGTNTTSPESRERIRQAIERELAARGLTRVEAHEADFFVTYHVEVRREIQLRTETPAMTTLPTLHQDLPYEVQRSERRLVFYEEVRLAIDAADGRERQLVWRGLAQRRDRGSIDPHLDETVAEILVHFPVSRPTDASARAADESS